jgi:hypothetical protein
MNVEDVYVGPRRGRRYRVVAIGPEPGKVQILALWDETARPQSATAALMTAANSWSLVRHPETT